MFRNSYDNDTVTFSPTGRIFQVEYALEAIKQGSAAVGIASNTHVVLVALKRNAEELGSYQKKITRIDDNMGLALAGLAPDARLLSNHLRTLSMRQQYLFDRPLAVNAAVASIADKAQNNTQQYGRRPYGVGLLVAGYDEQGPHLFEFLPSGSMLEYIGSAIGARSQAAKTYLERNFDSFADCELEQLIIHGLVALRDTLPQEKELTFQNTSIAVVGKDTKFTILEDEAVIPWLDKLDTTARKPHKKEPANEEAAGTIENDQTPAASTDADANTESADQTEGTQASNESNETVEENTGEQGGNDDSNDIDQDDRMTD